MRITPIDIQNKQFRAARMRGYNADDVDSFLDEIAAEIDSAGKEIATLQSQLQQSNTELTSFEELKGTLNSAIISAQKLADDIRAAAEADSARMIAEANQKVEEIHGDALSRHQSILASIDRLSDAEQTFRDRFVAMLSDFEGLVTSREVLTPADVIAQEAAVSADFAPAAPVEISEVQETLVPDTAAEIAEPVAEAVYEPAAEPAAEQIIEPAAEAEMVADPDPVADYAQPEPEASEDALAAFAAEVVAEPETEPVLEQYSYEIAAEQPVPEAAPEIAAPMSQEEPAAPETFVVPEVAPTQEISVVHEIAPEPAIEAPAEPEPVIEAEPAAATYDLGGAQVADDLSSKDEIAEAVERMRRMLGEAGVDPNPAPPAAAPASSSSENDSSLFEENPSSENFGAGAGFGDLGEGVPGVVRRRREGTEGSGSEVD